ncbi:haloacid dehalogenase-like hydrolase [Oscillatoria sp. CS-180]|uniref:haloacid dehalogenase-like hydrolase n=1 Tax=Oscillatoria sp. CS-180 TaxID=3021720 RepID=UPI00232C6924|nr:haloacid dehalogenase-like hydrolase [Oscillatoria sp. CS-180]MDB9524485.1 haloacid dehalogenase-like hydrolase [Oscillatoria sp. CS-180]
MPKATHPAAQKIAVVFDFDDTLVPDSFDHFLSFLGLDPAEFRKAKYESRKQAGWDAIPARFYSLIEYSKAQPPEKRITRSTLMEFGKSLQPFEGVSDMFTRLQQRVNEIAPEISIEFYLITSGFVEVARQTSIAKFFKAMWGCEFHYSESGEIEFLKRSLSHPEKPRYLYYLSRGINYSDDEDLLFVYKDVPPEELTIPLDQIIYVGDGTSDIPCFAMLNQEGGMAIGVYRNSSPEEWAKHYQPSQNQRVINLAPADYQEGSELMRSLTLAVESMCKKIQIYQLSHHE